MLTVLLFARGQQPESGWALLFHSVILFALVASASGARVEYEFRAQDQDNFATYTRRFELEEKDEAQELIDKRTKTRSKLEPAFPYSCSRLMRPMAPFTVR